MKTSKFLLSTLVAAAAMTSSAYADTTVGETVYAGGIYTFGGWNNANFHNGGYIRNGVSDDALTNEEFGGTGTWTSQTSGTFPSIASLFSSANNATPLNTLRFVSAGNVTIGGVEQSVTARAVSVSFSDLRLGGLIVESGAFGNSIVQSDARTFQLGDSTNAKTFVGTINENFTLTANNTNFHGSQNWTIASGKTLTVTNTGTVNRTVNLLGAGTLKIGTLSGAGRIDLGSTGNLTISNGTKFNNWTGTVALSDRTISHTAFAMNSHGTTGSTIELSGVDGVFAEFAGTVNANLHLINSETSGKEYGFKVKNGTSTGGFTLAGKITGTGDLVMEWGTGTSFSFTGNLSEYDGKILNTTSAIKNLTFTNTTLSDGETSITGTGDIDWKGNIYYNYTADVTAKNKIVSGNLTKQGAGALTLSGANSYTGGTTVAAGTLIAGSTSAFGSGNLTVASDASLSSGAYAVDLTSGNATINGTYIVTAEGSLATTGTITLSEGSIVDVSALESAGNYTIFSAGTFTNSGATFKKARVRDTATLSNEGVLTFTVGSVYEDLEWKSGVWKDGEKSWTRPGQEETFDFQAGDSVTFSTENASVTVEGTVAPNKMTVSAATTLTGTGTVEVANADLTTSATLSIAEGVTLALGTEENGTLNKNITGSGTISWGNTAGTHDTTINLSNDFSGVLQLSGNINSGAFNIGSTEKIIADGVWFWGSGVKAISADIVVTDRFGSGEAISSNFHVNGENGGINVTGDFLAEGRIVTFAQGTNTLSGETNTIGTLNVSGGTTTISGTGTNTIGTLSHRGGSTVFESDVTITGDGFRFDSSGSFNGSSTIKEGVTVNATTFHNSWGFNTLTVNGTLNVTGDMNLVSGTENKVVGSGTINVNHLDAGNAGTYTFSGVTLNIGTGGITGNTQPLTFGKMTIGVRDDASSWTAARGFAIGSTEGTTFQTDKNKSISVTGVVSGEGMLIKSGAGTLTLSGANTYEGGTMISAGTLIAGSASALGTKAVTVSGGQLNVMNNVTISNAINIVLADGRYAESTKAAITGAGDSASNVTGAITVSFAGADQAALEMLVEGSYYLWDKENVTVSSDVTYNFEGLEGYNYTVTDGLLTFSAIPEPSAFGLLAGVGALALVAARRRRRK